eukprot:1138415-Pelagomonas_calceolata.AAC.8
MPLCPSVQVPVIATMVEMSGRVVFQNAASQFYWGRLESPSGTGQHSTRSSACSNVSRGAPGMAIVRHILLAPIVMHAHISLLQGELRCAGHNSYETHMRCMSLALIVTHERISLVLGMAIMAYMLRTPIVRECKPRWSRHTSCSMHALQMLRTRALRLSVSASPVGPGMLLTIKQKA